MSDAIEAEARSVGIREWAPLAVISFKDYERRKAEIAAQLLVACRTAGFFYIVDHGLPTEEIEKMYGLIRGVHALPLEEHVRYKSSAAQDGNYHGYVGSDKIKDGVTAYFNVAAPGTGLAKPMPPVMQTSKPAIDFFQEKVLDVNDRLLQLLSVSMQLPEDYFSKLHNRNAVSGSHLRFMWWVLLLSDKASRKSDG